MKTQSHPSSGMAETAEASESPSWRASGLVTLLTDFGSVDPYVGIMKGVLLSGDARATLVDLTHEVPPQSVRVAAHMLANSWSFFPRGTVHLAVVDPGVGTDRKLLVAEHSGHAFLAPDNGLLGGILDARSGVFELDLARFARRPASKTFHGRDILAPAAAAIAAGLAPAGAGVRKLAAWERLDSARPTREGGRSVGEILYADRYGNLVTNLAAAEIDGRARARVELCGASIPVRATYGDVAPGELVALVNSYACVEIAVRDGSARERLGADAGTRVVMTSERGS